MGVTQQDIRQKVPKEHLEVARKYNTSCSIESQLPITFSNGIEYSGFTVPCDQCGVEIGGEHLRGRVNQHSADKTVIEAHGICFRCQQFTSITFRLSTAGHRLVAQHINRSGVHRQELDPNEALFTSLENYKKLNNRRRELLQKY